MTADDEDSDVPDTGAVFTFGKCRFNDNIPGKFWLRDDKVCCVSCGDEHTVIVSALIKERIILVACGRSHTIVAAESGKIFSFGAANEGQLGFDAGHQDRVAVPTEIHLPGSKSGVNLLHAGGNHSACLTVSGEVFVWGCGSEGQLGLGKAIDKQLLPVQVSIGDKVVQVACGYYHTMFVTDSGKLYACGEPDSGKLGCSPSTDIDHWSPQLVNGFSDKVISVSCGHNHTVAVTDSGKAYAFGDGSNGQLGCGNKCLESHSPQLIPGLSTSKVVQASCGEGHTALVTQAGVLFTFGDGRHGKLALGDENLANHFSPTIVMRFKSLFVEQVLCGGCHTVVIAKKLPLCNVGDQVVVSDKQETVEDRLAMVNELMQQSDLSDSVDLSSTITARSRRRQKVPDLNDQQPNLPQLSLQTSSGSHGNDTPVAVKKQVPVTDVAVTSVLETQKNKEKEEEMFDNTAEAKPIDQSIDAKIPAKEMQATEEQTMLQRNNVGLVSMAEDKTGDSFENNLNNAAAGEDPAKSDTMLTKVTVNKKLPKIGRKANKKTKQTAKQIESETFDKTTEQTVINDELIKNVNNERTQLQKDEVNERTKLHKDEVQAADSNTRDEKVNVNDCNVGEGDTDKNAQTSDGTSAIVEQALKTEDQVTKENAKEGVIEEVSGNADAAKQAEKKKSRLCAIL